MSASSKQADVLAGTTSVGENAASAEAWGTGSTEVQAKIDAIRSALAKLQGNYFDVNTIVENDLIVKDKVLVWTRWPNLRMGVVGREVVAKVFRVKVRISNDIPSAPVDLVPREGFESTDLGLKYSATQKSKMPRKRRGRSATELMSCTRSPLSTTYLGWMAVLEWLDSETKVISLVMQAVDY